MTAATNYFEDVAKKMHRSAGAIELLNTDAAKYTMCLQLSNSSGLYSHPRNAAGLRIYKRNCSLIKNVAADKWGCGCAIITRIDETDADLYFPCPCACMMGGTDLLVVPADQEWASGFDYTIDPNDTAAISAGKRVKNALVGGIDIELGVTDVNTATPLSVNGLAATVIPAVGDVLCVCYQGNSVFPEIAVNTGKFHPAWCIQYTAVDANGAAL